MMQFFHKHFVLYSISIIIFLGLIWILSMLITDYLLPPPNCADDCLEVIWNFTHKLFIIILLSPLIIFSIIIYWWFALEKIEEFKK